LLSKAVDVHLFTLGSVVGIERDSVCVWGSDDKEENRCNMRED